MKEALKSPENFQSTLNAALQQLGKEDKMLNERVVPGAELQVYTRLFTPTAMNIQLVFSAAMDAQGGIQGMAVRPVANPAESKYLDYRPKAQLQFPLRGEWTVYQGGRSVYDNYHAEYHDERFAYDILLIHADSSMFAGDGSRLEQWYGFGQPVFADADGKVVIAVDQNDDNPPNKPSTTAPKCGNQIVIDHGNNEFAMFCHLKRGSVKVKPGDSVKAGQELAAVGNSGNSPLPHLHYHMQDTSEIFKGEGLPTPFQKLVVNGKPVSNAEPVRGDVVRMD